ncbi:hypothetical protein [Aquibacillus saliphilus]|uniref:hypothetical protein n=1 Tax=Aquibacillus saliphilus TaxID=1909422 RepID=UPI001CF0C6BC|nr:hypothetical protein [Aquibacillus saliphilus]
MKLEDALKTVEVLSGMNHITNQQKKLYDRAENLLKQYKGEDKMTTPSKTSYEQALETAKKYEKRQRELKYIDDQLSAKLQQFTQVKFRVNTSRREVTFAGIVNGELKLTTSKCSVNDCFEVNIGKLIAVKKSLKEKLDDVTDLVESENNITVDTSGFQLRDHIISNPTWTISN